MLRKHEKPFRRIFRRRQQKVFVCVQFRDVSHEILIIAIIINFPRSIRRNGAESERRNIKLRPSIVRYSLIVYCQIVKRSIHVHNQNRILPHMHQSRPIPTIRPRISILNFGFDRPAGPQEVRPLSIVEISA